MDSETRTEYRVVGENQRTGTLAVLPRETLVDATSVVDIWRKATYRGAHVYDNVRIQARTVTSWTDRVEEPHTDE